MPANQMYGPGIHDPARVEATKRAIDDLQPIIVDAIDLHGQDAVMNALASFWMTGMIRARGVEGARVRIGELWKLAAPIGAALEGGGHG